MIHGKTQTKTESHGIWSCAFLFTSVLFCAGAKRQGQECFFRGLQYPDG